MNDSPRTDESPALVDDDAIAAVARALSHPARIRIVRLLAGQDVCRGADLFAELPLAQSTVSEHLRVLKEAGLVSSAPRGASMVYCLAPSALERFTAALSEILDVSSACVREECS